MPTESNPSNHTRIEPIFQCPTPLLFAHRGGVWETPESTEKGFRHAIDHAKADVLELDIHLTRDGEFVVWHGPDLDNVRIDGAANRPSARPEKRRKIYHYDWPELDDKAWVADPEIKSLPLEQRDLSCVPQDPDRCLLRLDDFLQKFPTTPLNIEMKSSFKRKFNEADRRGSKDNIRAFSQILNAGQAERIIVVVSAKDDHIDEFRAINGSAFPTGLSAEEQPLLRIPFTNKDMTNRALETSHNKHLASKSLIEMVREKNGSTFVFLTGFGPLKAIDKNEPNPGEIFEILDRGADGIMTDRPFSVRKIIDQWKNSHP